MSFLNCLLLCFYSILIFCSNCYSERRFGFPETTNYIAIMADQLPNYLTKSQIKFAATHYIGSQKLTLPITKRLRSYNPNFVVLHYHLGIWQQSPGHKFIIDGKHWGNDWHFVNRHEDWFWHNEHNERVRSRIDGKFLMNIANQEWRNYWKRSIAKQIILGEYQGVFLDSSSPALLPWEAAHDDPRLAKTAAVKRHFPELGGLTWSEAYASFMKDLTNFLESLGFATIPNVGNFFTTWDTTDYYTTASGAFIEGAFNTRSQADWKMAMERSLKLIKRDKIVIFQSPLRTPNDYSKRLYYLACYLLIKGKFCYLNYFVGSTLSWFPEWKIDLGRPKKVYISSLNDLKVTEGLYQRKFEKGEVWVNISKTKRKIFFKNRKTYLVIPKGGGPVNKQGREPGTLTLKPISQVELLPWQGIILLY